MKDFMDKYKKNKIIWNIWIVMFSLILAFWINIFLIDSTNMWDWLKTSILNATDKTQKADLYLEKIGNKIILKNSKNINDSQNLFLSISYNPENIKNIDVTSDINTPNIISQNTWISSIILNTNWKTYKKNDRILEIIVEKKEEKIENINIINANFKDTTWEIYKLTTSWITF